MRRSIFAVPSPHFSPAPSRFLLAAGPFGAGAELGDDDDDDDDDDELEDDDPREDDSSLELLHERHGVGG